MWVDARRRGVCTEREEGCGKPQGGGVFEQVGKRAVDRRQEEGCLNR